MEINHVAYFSTFSTQIPWLHVLNRCTLNQCISRPSWCICCMLDIHLNPAAPQASAQSKLMMRNDLAGASVLPLRWCWGRRRARGPTFSFYFLSLLSLFSSHSFFPYLFLMSLYHSHFSVCFSHFLRFQIPHFSLPQSLKLFVSFHWSLK